MITGQKPGGYFVTADAQGRKIEGETRQCVHCQFVWEYQPGSGITRGWCIKCGGFLCAREQCLKMQFDLCAQYLHETGKVVSCIPWADFNERRRERILREVSNLSMI